MRSIQRAEIVLAPLLVAILWKLMFEPYEPIDAAAYADAHVDTVLRRWRPDKTDCRGGAIA